jgi:hypothetical protein
VADRRAGRGVAVAALVLATAVVLALPAVAQTSRGDSVTATQLRALAERAAADPGALAQLRAVRQVDGRPADMARALDGAQGPALAARLRSLAGGADTASAVGPIDPRRDAADILGGRRFKESRVPRPLQGVLRRLGSWLEPIARPVGRLWGRLGDVFGLQLAVVVVVIAVAFATSLRLIRRHAPSAVARRRGARAAGGQLDPDRLEREAEEAEGAGDLDRAVRLRFVAGLLRLDRAGVLAYQPSLTTGQLRRLLRSGSFAQLAVAFDEIAYGGRHAAAPDVERARQEWPRVLEEASR